MSDIMRLLYDLRFYCILLAYFPEGSDYHKDFENYESHPGWKDFVTVREAKIAKNYKKAIQNLERSNTDVAVFDSVDIEFGKYRHERWYEKYVQD